MGGGHKEDMPVDRGWAWVICGAVFFLHIFITNSFLVLAVILLDLTEELDSSLTTVSLILLVKMLCVSVACIISVHFLVPKFGLRFVGTLASFLFSLCGIGYAYAWHIGIFIALATIRGCMIGVFNIPALSLIGFYFDKRRSLATTIAVCGTSVSAISWPRFVRYVMSFYGLRGTLLLNGALEANLMVCILLMRPVNSYRVPNTDGGGVEVELVSSDLNNKHSSDNTLNDNRFLTVKDNSGMEPKEYATAKDSLLKGSPNDDLYCYQTEGNNEESDYTRHYSDHGNEECISPQSFNKGSKISIEGTTSEKKFPSVWSLASGFEVGTVSPSHTEEQNTPVSCWGKINQIFDFSFFREWPFIWIILATFPYGTNPFIFTYLPTMANFKGVSKDDGALLLVILGGMDLFSRMIMGFLADSKLLRVSTIIGLSGVFLGIVCLFVEFYNDMSSLIAMTVIMGLFVGARISLVSIMFIDVFGVDRMAKAFSLYTMCITVSGASHNPMLGSLLETAGVNAVMYYIGCAFICAGLLFATIPLIIKLERKYKKLDWNVTNSSLNHVVN